MQAHVLEDVLMDMQMLSMVKPYQKLSVCDNRFALESFNTTATEHQDGVPPEETPKESYFTSLRRFFGNQNRRNVLQKLRQRVTELENYVLNDLVQEQWIKRQLRRLHPLALQGIRNLQVTYREDSQTYVHLDVIAQRMANLFDTDVYSTNTTITSPASDTRSTL